MRRRGFFRWIAGAGGALVACRPTRQPPPEFPELDLSRTLGLSAPADTLRPLDVITVDVDGAGTLEAIDGDGVTYFRAAVDTGVSITVGGALGTHHVVYLDEHGRLLDRATFRVDAATELHDGSGRFAALLELARWTLHADYNRLGRHIRIGGTTYHHLVYWLRDHVFAAEGARYFRGELRTGIDLYADTQREDGMIWDNVERRPGREKTAWEARFAQGGFARAVDDGRWELKRIPVTNDVEALFVEGLYRTWQATDDLAWMLGHLDAAEAALQYPLRDGYRWSDKYQLLKRGYSIDAWDFVSSWDADATGDAMVIDPERSELGVCFGDNLLYASSCEKLAAMMTAVGRDADAAEWAQRGAEIRERTDALSWLGTHYHHHVPENPAVARDLGVDDTKQVSLSNAYALLHSIATDHAAAIVKTYRHLRADLPRGTPAEFYSIHPPFPRGFEDHALPGQYVNGGVLPVVGARLGHGALTHGQEKYGVDVLLRLGELATRLSDGLLAGAYRGGPAPPSAIDASPIALGRAATTRYPPGNATRGGKSFADDPGYGPVELGGVRFEITASAIVLGRGDEQVRRARIDAKREPFASLYLLHEADGDVAGVITLRYADGTSARIVVDRAYYGNWWRAPKYAWPRHVPGCVRVWRSDNAQFASVWVAAIDNPQPSKPLKRIELEASAQGAAWRIMAVATAPGPAALDHGPVSYGVPVGWGAGSLTKALIEGLAGVQDHGAGLRNVTLTPRWAAAEESEVSVTARYPDGRGFVSYRYLWERGAARLSLTFTGGGEQFGIRVMLPPDFEVSTAEVDGVGTTYSLDTVGPSKYLVLDVQGRGAHRLVLLGSASSPARAAR
ncbi:MAG: hypothetical protein AAF721_04980 [Myxococcota bacterium]